MESNEEYLEELIKEKQKTGKNVEVILLEIINDIDGFYSSDFKEFVRYYLRNLIA